MLQKAVDESVQILKNYINLYIRVYSDDKEYLKNVILKRKTTLIMGGRIINNLQITFIS